MKNKAYKEDNALIKENARRQLTSRLAQLAANTLTTRETEVLQEVLVKDKSFREIAYDLKLTPGRVKQIFYKAMMRLGRQLDSFELKLKDYHKTMIDYSSIKERLAKYEKVEQTKSKLESLPTETRELLLKKIINSDLPARIKSLGANNKIETLADLVRFTPNELMRYRNCGKLSIAQLESYFAMNGLYWGMLDENKD